MLTLITIIHIAAALFLIVIVLLQTGKGASIGAVFGGGSSQTLFGSRGAGNFLTKMTTGAAVIFMLTSLGMSMISSRGNVSTIAPGKTIDVEQKEKTSAEAPVKETTEETATEKNNNEGPLEDKPQERVN